MTSSLVGSEMCIRDRIGPHCLGEVLVELPANCRQRQAPPSGRHRQGADCLLYTSDAADDM
eukprot:8920038-Prorocentrum_lima.AAC.1